MHSMLFEITAVLLTTVLSGTQGYPDGCPEVNCLYGYAKHGYIQPQTGESPYILIVDKTEYDPDDNITEDTVHTAEFVDKMDALFNAFNSRQFSSPDQMHHAFSETSGHRIFLEEMSSWLKSIRSKVTIQGRNGESFKGFSLRAHRYAGLNDKEEIIGDFVEFTEEAHRYKQVWKNTREGIESNCVTHKDSSEKTVQTFVWRAPLQSEGDLVFKLGIVVEFDIFWKDIESVIKAKQPAVPQPDYKPVYPDFDDFLFHASCGKTKGCFMYPRGCQDAECDYIFAYKPINNGTHFKFELSGRTDNYISIGLSHDKKMGNEVSFNCLIDEEGGLHIKNGFNPDLFQTPQENNDLTDKHIAYQDGRVYCSFVRPTVLTMVNSLVEIYGLVESDLTKNYYIMAARGLVYPGSYIIQKHIELPAISGGEVSLLESTITSGNQLPVELQLHATFGVLGYLFVMGFGMLLVRHFREELGSLNCGKPRWLQGHIALLIFAVIFAAVAVIMISVYLKAWTLYATIHAVFGLVALGLMLINVIAGLARPSPDDARRPIFTWMHRIGGVLAYICAVVCCILGCRVELLSLTLQRNGTILVAVGFGFILLIEVILEITKCRSTGIKEYDLGAGSKGGMGMEEKQPKRGCFKLKYFLLFLYFIVLAVIVILFLYYLYFL